MRRSRLGIFACLVQCASPALAQAKQQCNRIAAPISVAPSGQWDGDDGPWSTFSLRVGTPPQVVRVLVSTVAQQTLLVSPEGCIPDFSGCANDRGNIYTFNDSSTWRSQGQYRLTIESNLDMGGDVIYGNETLGFGSTENGNPTLQNQTVGRISSYSFYLGLLGVNPRPDVWSSVNSQASLLTNLKAQGFIPSLSLGYTAGALYRPNKPPASLTLGGYDQSRFNPNPLTFSFADDPNRDLVVGIQTITSVNQDGTSVGLLSAGINAFVDTTVSQIFLPLVVCQAFEKAFGLVYDSDSDLYLVNETQHNALLKQNANITFSLSNTISGGEATSIVLPYASFDLNITNLTTQSSSWYFPLRRATNESQYTLGRTFLQETYLTVDWERRNFSIYQSNFSFNAPLLQAISSTTNMTSTPVDCNNGSDNGSNNGSSGHGKTIGIAVGVTVGVLAIIGALIIFFFLWRRKRGKSPQDEKHDGNDDTEEEIRQGRRLVELDAGSRHEMPSSPPPVSWIDEKGKFPGDRTKAAELRGNGVNGQEISGGNGSVFRSVHELHDPAAHPAAAELPSNQHSELHGSTPSLVDRIRDVPSPGFPSQGLPSPGLPSPGLPSPGLPSPGLPSPGLPSPGLPSPPLTSAGASPILRSKTSSPLIRSSENLRAAATSESRPSSPIRSSSAISEPSRASTPSVTGNQPFGVVSPLSRSTAASPLGSDFVPIQLPGAQGSSAPRASSTRPMELQRAVSLESHPGGSGLLPEPTVSRGMGIKEAPAEE